MTNIEKFDLYNDGNERRLFWRVGNSFELSDKKIVFIVHDAHNVFEDKYAGYGTGWKIHEVLEKLNINNYLVIGLECANGVKRLREYSPVENRLELLNDPDFSEMNNYPFIGHKYLESLNTKLVDFIEKKFNFSFNDSFKIMLGSSMGGVITTYAAKVWPTRFNAYLAFSNAFYANDPYIWDLIEKDNKIGDYYHDMGGKEVSGAIANSDAYSLGFERMHKYLKSTNAKFMSVFDSNAIHNEKDWNKRLAGAILWALNKDKD